MISNAAFATCRPTNERARFAPQPSRLIGRHDRSAAFHPARSDSCALPAVNPSPRSGGFLLAWFYDPPRLETPIARVERQSDTPTCIFSTFLDSTHEPCDLTDRAILSRGRRAVQSPRSRSGCPDRSSRALEGGVRRYVFIIACCAFCDFFFFPLFCRIWWFPYLTDPSKTSANTKANVSSSSAFPPPTSPRTACPRTQTCRRASTTAWSRWTRPGSSTTGRRRRRTSWTAMMATRTRRRRGERPPGRRPSCPPC